MEKNELYPFIIQNRLVRIRGSGFNNALDKVLSKHQNKFIKTKFAKNMDLITAKDAAKKESLAQKKPFYVIIDSKDGEADISSAPLADALHKFKDGVEDKTFAPNHSTTAQKTEKPKTLPNQSEKAQKLISKSKVQQMEKLKKTAKKVAKKVIAKKSSPNKVDGVIRGNNMKLTKEQWAKVDTLLKKEDKTFSAFSRDLVLAKIK